VKTGLYCHPTKTKKLTIKLSSIFSLIALISINCNQPQEKTENIVSPDSAAKPMVQQPLKTVDKNIVIGNWERTDAPYQIRISAVLSDGKLIAGYFNPNTINVGKAEWANTSTGLKLYIELQDKNYPGSNYKLSYLPEYDILSGIYFQAVEGQTFEVEFARKK
jgi:hypothetical protein